MRTSRKATASKSAPGRTGRRRTTRTRAPATATLAAKTGNLEMTPLEGRQFAREYALKDAALGVAVTAEEGTRACGSVAHGCAWCRTHNTDNHHERDAS